MMNKPVTKDNADHLPWPDTEPEVKWLSAEAIERVFGQQGKSTAPVPKAATARKPETGLADRQPT